MKNVYINSVNPCGRPKQNIVDTMKSTDATVRHLRLIMTVILISFFTFYCSNLSAQNCPTTGTSVVSVNENTYYKGTQSTVAAGTTSITLGAIGTGTDFGNTPIAIGDILLIIQMQGAKINVPATVTSAAYGGGTSSGAGFLTTNLMAGNMEFIIATNAVPVGGGTLNISAGLTYNYANAPFGTDGQYTYQVIRVSTHYNIQLGGNVSVPKWNGSTGGVMVVSAVNQVDFNGKTINAIGAGFRGGGSSSFNGAAGTNKNDFYTLTSVTANGGKAEGIAGTPRYVYNGSALVDNVVEGYPSGSRGRGAPGNGGGGATDSNPTSNDQNAGGGGGGNGGAGGLGGNGWYSFGTTGGRGGSAFQTSGPTTTYYSPSRLILGGGGGGGSNNNSSGTPGGGVASSGAAGGGLVIINASTILGTGTINASGAAPNSTVTVDGSGGGGAGGSILVYANSGQSGIIALANGSDGSSNNPAGSSATQHGPGGGGGGGVIYSNSPLNASSSATFGLAGISYGSSATDSYGALKGTAGIVTTNINFASLPPNMQICQAIVLPVTILHFTASYVSANNTKVNWSTTDEVNADYFVVERSSNGTDFIGVATVPASESNSPVHSYSVNDQLYNITGNTVYYRLRIVDTDGKFTYSKVVAVKLDQPENTISIYPNPVDNYFILNIYADKPGTGMLRLMDNGGKQILTKTLSVTNGNNSITIDALGYLPRGIYIVQILVNSDLYTQKIVKK